VGIILLVLGGRVREVVWSCVDVVRVWRDGVGGSGFAARDSDRLVDSTVR
jgi:hypothetical protein